MMLQVENTISEMNSVTEVDEYIPLFIAIGEQPAQLLYWRAGNGSTSLMELGVNPSSGAVQSVTLVTLEQCSTKEGVVFSLGATASTNGSVIVDTGLIVFGLSENNTLLSVAVVALTSQELAVFDSCVPITRY